MNPSCFGSVFIHNRLHAISSVSLDACAERNVKLEAYSPLGTGRHLGDPAVVGIAERLGRSPAQVLIRWCLQRETVVIPKSTHRERIDENGAVFDFELREEDMRAIIAYVRMLPPVKNKVPADRAPAPDDCDIYTFWTSASTTYGCK